MITPRKKTNGKTVYDVRVGRGTPSRTFDRKADAEEYESNQRRDRRRARAGMEVEKEAITYDQLCELYLESITRPSKEWTEKMLGYSRKKWGGMYVRQLQPELIVPWLRGLKGRNGRQLAEKTRHHILERMRAACAMGVEWGYLDRSPVRARAVPSPGTERATAIAPFEDWADVELLANALAAEYAPWGSLVRFACSTGLRPGEWQALDWSHIDREANEVNVPGTKNENAVRQVPLSTPALAALDALATPLRRSQPLFTTQTGKPLRKDNYHYWRKRHWKLAFVSAGVEYREPYEMRHTFATLALQAGVPLEVVSKYMGHSSIEITRRFYAKFTRTTLQMYVPMLNKIGETDGLSTAQDHIRA